MLIKSRETNLQKLVFYFLLLQALERVSLRGNFYYFLKKVSVLRSVHYIDVLFIETAL